MESLLSQGVSSAVLGKRLIGLPIALNLLNACFQRVHKVFLFFFVFYVKIRLTSKGRSHLRHIRLMRVRVHRFWGSRKSHQHLSGLGIDIDHHHQSLIHHSWLWQTSLNLFKKLEERVWLSPWNVGILGGWGLRLRHIFSRNVRFFDVYFKSHDCFMLWIFYIQTYKLNTFYISRTF